LNNNNTGPHIRIKWILPTVCKFYNLNPKPFHIYPSETNHKKKVVAKSQKFKIEQFIRLDFLNICFDSKNKKNGLPYSHFIRICGPVLLLFNFYGFGWSNSWFLFKKKLTEEVEEEMDNLIIVNEEDQSPSYGITHFFLLPRGPTYWQFFVL